MTPIPEQARSRPIRKAALLAAGLGAVLMLAAAPAMAKGGHATGERCGAAAGTDWEPIGAVSEKLEAEGYTDFLRIQRARGCYEVIARKPDERPIRLWVNPASLEVTGFSRMWRPHASAGHRHQMRMQRMDRHAAGEHRMKGAWGRKGEPGMHRRHGAAPSVPGQVQEQPSPAQD